MHDPPSPGAASDGVAPVATAATRALLAHLATASAQASLDAGRGLVIGGDVASGHLVFEAANARFPDDAELRLALAGTHWQRGEGAAARTQLLSLLAAQPANVAAGFLLARICRAEGRMHAAEAAITGLFAHVPLDADTVLRASDLLNDCGRIEAAAALCERAIAAGSTDPRLHAYAGMLLLQVGDFDRSRERYAFAIARSPLAPEWEAPYGMSCAKRHRDAGDADFALFDQLLTRTDLSPRARASLHFALGKAQDDVDDAAAATASFRAGNTILKDASEWSRKQWRRAVDAKIGAGSLPRRDVRGDERVPLFIVGAPRSGTTLLAELLARAPSVCNRGESNGLPEAARRLAAAGKPSAHVFEGTAEAYLRQLVQDDSDARWFIDKRPLNVLHLDLIHALFPQARIVHCVRNGRDTALSIWMQNFAGRDYDFASDFADIDAVLRGAERLVGRAVASGAPIFQVTYERLIADASACVAELAEWIGMPAFDITAIPSAPRVIRTASAWQARQPVHSRSVGRWRAYAPFVPELLKIRDG